MCLVLNQTFLRSWCLKQKITKSKENNNNNSNYNNNNTCKIIIVSK